MKSSLNHVAFLVRSIEESVESESIKSDACGEIEEFPSEGTRELYLGKGHDMGRLLLMQAIGDGPYKSALEKRGPGLHHIAIDVEDIDSFVDQLAGSGWSLHPKSLIFYKENKMIFLCRPGTPVLIEINERKLFEEDSFYIEHIEFPFSNTKLLESLGCGQLSRGDSLRILRDGEAVCQSLM